MSEPVIRSIPLSQLELSPANVRKTPVHQTAFDELKASIAVHGLLENLIVRCLGPGPDSVGRYAVIAGGRRLTALMDLARDGVFSTDFPVPCLTVDNAARESELSLAENVVRVAMHPVDQVQAFGALAEAGASVADMAARFGVPERTVEQRLRLGNAAPELLDAYREGDIDMDTLMAFAVTTDQDRQLAVWEQVKEQSYRSGAWQVKRMLTEDRVQGNADIARFVGIEDYEAAGGTLTRDLFADEDDRGVWFDDPELLRRLAGAKLKAAASDLQSDWKWVEPRLDVDWNATARYGRVSPKPGEPTEDESAEIERLRTRHDELVNLDDGDWTDELIEEGEAIEARLDEIEAIVESRATFRPEHKALAGCIVTIGNDGNLRVIEGLVRPEDVPDASKAPAESEDDEDDDLVTGIRPALASPADPARKARADAGVGIGLADDLRAVRTGDVKTHLAQDFDAAFDLLLFQLARGVFRNGYRADALDITVRETVDRPIVRGNDSQFPEMDTREQDLAADRAELKLGWMREENDGDAFEKLCSLSDTEKRHLFASCVARTVKGQLAFEHGARPGLEHTIARLDIDFATRFRPTAELFWKRIVKNRILAIARQTLGEAWAQAHAKFKKAELADTMEEAFAAGDGAPAGVTAEARMAALAWTPPGFRAFDEGGIDPDGQPDTAEPVDPPAAEEPEEIDAANSEPKELDGDAAPAPLADADGAAAVTVEPDLPESVVASTEETPPEPVDYDAVRITIANGGRDITAERERVLAPPRGNGQAPAPGSGDLLEIPAFLRRTP